MTNYLRPDEEQTYSEIGKAQDRDSLLKKGVKTALSAIPIAGTAAISSKIAPFLSQYINPETALKGISKISPKMGEFLQKGISMGLPLEEGLDYIKDRMNSPKEEAKKEKSNKKQNLNELGQFSPELQQFVETKIQEGKSPDHAAALAMNQAEHSDLVRGIEKKTKKRFTAFVREIYEGKAIEPKQSQGKDLSNWTKGLNPDLKQFERQDQQYQGLDPGVAQIIEQGKALMQQLKGGM